MTEFNVVIYGEHNIDCLEYDVLHVGSVNTLLQQIYKNAPLVLKLGGIVQVKSDKIFAIEIREVGVYEG
jgi:hypothetical protein